MFWNMFVQKVKKRSMNDEHVSIGPGSQNRDLNDVNT